MQQYFRTAPIYHQREIFRRVNLVDMEFTTFLIKEEKQKVNKLKHHV